MVEWLAATSGLQCEKILIDNYLGSSCLILAVGGGGSWVELECFRYSVFFVFFSEPEGDWILFHTS